MFYEKNKTKRPKKKISLAGVKPRTFDMQGQGAIYCAMTANCKLIKINYP